jgi:predicted enzyme related to lactoylglutathione lyase
MANPVTHFEIHGRDGKKTQAFYASLFGWTVDADNPMDYGMVSAQETSRVVPSSRCSPTPMAT